MPLSLSKNSSKDGDFVDKKVAGAIQETQTVRENGILKKIPVDGIHRVYSQESDFEDLVDQSVLNSEPSGVGMHLDQQSNRSTPRSYNTDLESHRRADTINIYAVINQAIDKVIVENRDCYDKGWERDPDFVKATVDLVFKEFDFDKSEIEEAIRQR